MGVDFMAINHAKREYILLDRPLRQGGIMLEKIEILLYRWAGDPIVFVSDSSTCQDLYALMRTGDVETYGHVPGCSRGMIHCLCHSYGEVI